MTENITEHKNLKEFDLKMLKDVLKEKRKHGDHTHGQRKELIILRGDVAIKVIWERDKADTKKYQRKTKLLMLTA